MDSGPEPGYDRLTRLARRLLNAPVALVTLLDDRRQYFKSQSGLPPALAGLDETPLSHSFCRHVVETGQAMRVGDVTVTPAVCENPALEDLPILAYLGVPVRSDSGQVLGSICAIDFQPRCWSEEELELLGELAATAETEIRLRTQLRRQADETREELRQTIAALRAVQRMARVEQWTWDVVGERVFRSDLGASETRAHPFPAELTVEEFLSRVAPEDAPRLEASMERVRLRPEHLTESFTFSGPDGRSVCLHVEAAPVADEGGRVTHFVGTLQDQTRQRELESQFFATQKLEAIGQMAGGIAHDFSNVLSVVKGFTELIRGDLPADSPIQADLKEIMGAADQGGRLIKQLMMFARKSKLGKESLDLHEMIEERKQMLKLCLKSGDELEVSLDAAEATLWLNRSQVEQLLLNLVGNAADAIGEKGQVSVSTRDLVLEEVRKCSDGGRLDPGSYLALTVRDNGMGIGEERGRIFEPLFTTKPKGKGTGLGLSVCSYIAREARGGIDLTSSPGQGAAFEVFLPLQQGSAEP